MSNGNGIIRWFFFWKVTVMESLFFKIKNDTFMHGGKCMIDFHTMRASNNPSRVAKQSVATSEVVGLLLAQMKINHTPAAMHESHSQISSNKHFLKSQLFLLIFIS